jgi:hypothetical protein
MPRPMICLCRFAQQRATQPKRSGRPRATVVTGYLVLDDSVQFKPKGRRMEGLGCHYSGGEKRKRQAFLS